MEDKDIDLLLMSELSYINTPETVRYLSENINYPVQDLARSGIKDEQAWLDWMDSNGQYTDDPKKKSTEQITHEQRLATYNKIATDNKYADWIIEGYKNDNAGSGFVGYAINTGGVPIIVSRGSESKEGPDDTRGMLDAIDWQDNFRLSYLPDTDQQAAALAFLEKMINEKGYTEVNLTGHSKGGNNAIYAAMAYLYNNLGTTVEIHCTTYNAPGFPKEFFEKYEYEIAKLKDNIVEYQTQFDKVSSIFNNIGKINLIESSITDKGCVSFLHHGLWAFLDDNGNFMPTAETKDLSSIAMYYISNSVAENTYDWALDWLIDGLITRVEDITWSNLYIIPECLFSLAVTVPSIIIDVCIVAPDRFFNDLLKAVGDSIHNSIELVLKSMLDAFMAELNVNPGILAELDVLKSIIAEEVAYRRESLNNYLQAIQDGLIDFLNNSIANSYAAIRQLFVIPNIFGNKESFMVSYQRMEELAKKLEDLRELCLYAEKISREAINTINNVNSDYDESRVRMACKNVLEDAAGITASVPHVADSLSREAQILRLAVTTYKEIEQKNKDRILNHTCQLYVCNPVFML